jgi:hypothetical protein
MSEKPKSNDKVRYKPNGEIAFQSLIRGKIEQAVNYHDPGFAADHNKAMSYIKSRGDTNIRV